MNIITRMHAQRIVLSRILWSFGENEASQPRPQAYFFSVNEARGVSTVAYRDSHGQIVRVERSVMMVMQPPSVAFASTTKVHTLLLSLLQCL